MSTVDGIEQGYGEVGGIERSEEPIRNVELSLGTIRCRDEGHGPAIVFLHGLFVSATLWRRVIPPLVADGFRCIAPDLPLGSHTIPIPAGSELSPGSVARLVAELLDTLDLDDVTIVANDTGGAIAQLLVTERPERVGRLVLTPCDAYESFFPRLFRPLQWAARVPPLLTLNLQLLRVRALRRLPVAFGWLSKRPVPAEIGDEWLEPFLSDAAIRRDAVRFIRAVDARLTLAAAERLRSFERPVLLAWASEDRVFPLALARRLQAAFPDARLVEVPDSYTFVPEDQPRRLAELVASFVRDATFGVAPDFPDPDRSDWDRGYG